MTDAEIKRFNIQQRSGMIALYPSNRHALAIEGGEAPEKLHVTIAYLGSNVESLTAAVRNGVLLAAGEAAPLYPNGFHAMVVGTTRFSMDVGPEASVLLLNSPELLVIYNTVWKKLSQCGTKAFPTQLHYVPHLTIGYGLPLSTLRAFNGLDIYFDGSITVRLSGHSINLKYDPLPKEQV